MLDLDAMAKRAAVQSHDCYADVSALIAEVRRLTRPHPPNGLLVRVYDVLSDCVETGIAFGIKELRERDQGSVRNRLHVEIMNAISEKFLFPEHPDQ